MKELDALSMNRGFFLDMKVEDKDSGVGKGMQKDASSTFETHHGLSNGNSYTYLLEFLGE